MNKREIRRMIHSKRRALPAAALRQAGEAIARQLSALEIFQQADCIYSYLAYNREVPTLPCLQLAQRDGKQIAVPKVVGNKIQFVYLSDLREIAPGYKGIPEPIANEPVAKNPHALVLVPGLAFDHKGNRIGYGGGFYDRFLQAEPEHPTVGLAYDFQIYPHIPTELHDIPVQFVLTARIPPSPVPATAAPA